MIFAAGLLLIGYILWLSIVDTKHLKTVEKHVLDHISDCHKGTYRSLKTIQDKLDRIETELRRQSK